MIRADRRGPNAIVLADRATVLARDPDVSVGFEGSGAGCDAAHHLGFHARSRAFPPQAVIGLAFTPGQRAASPFSTMLLLVSGSFTSLLLHVWIVQESRKRD